MKIKKKKIHYWKDEKNIIQQLSKMENTSSEHFLLMGKNNKLAIVRVMGNFNIKVEKLYEFNV